MLNIMYFGEVLISLIGFSFGIILVAYTLGFNYLNRTTNLNFAIARVLLGWIIMVVSGFVAVHGCSSLLAIH